MCIYYDPNLFCMYNYESQADTLEMMEFQVQKKKKLAGKQVVKDVNSKLQGKKVKCDGCWGKERGYERLGPVQKLQLLIS